MSATTSAFCAATTGAIGPRGCAAVSMTSGQLPRSKTCGICLEGVMNLQAIDRASSPSTLMARIVSSSNLQETPSPGGRMVAWIGH